MAAYTTIKISPELAERVGKVAEALGLSTNAAGVRCVEEMLALIEQQEPRDLPDLVKMLDAVRSTRGFSGSGRSRYDLNEKPTAPSRAKKAAQAAAALGQAKKRK